MLSAGEVGDQVELSVQDSGPGLKAEDLGRIFERFYRADAARGRGGGPGLGLSVVAAIAELHHGRILAEPGGAGGLRVRIELPVG